MASAAAGKTRAEGRRGVRGRRGEEDAAAVARGAPARGGSGGASEDVASGA